MQPFVMILFAVALTVPFAAYILAHALRGTHPEPQVTKTLGRTVIACFALILAGLGVIKFDVSRVLGAFMTDKAIAGQASPPATDKPAPKAERPHGKDAAGKSDHGAVLKPDAQARADLPQSTRVEKSSPGMKRASQKVKAAKPRSRHCKCLSK